MQTFLEVSALDDARLFDGRGNPRTLQDARPQFRYEGTDAEPPRANNRRTAI